MSPGSLLRGGAVVAVRTVEGVAALPRIALALERLADAADDLRRLADVAPAVESLATLATDLQRLGEMAGTMAPLTDAVTQLNAAVASLSSTVSPLQGASERLGRLVDRLPASRGRRVLDAEP